jgi:hypothetical protein
MELEMIGDQAIGSGHVTGSEEPEAAQAARLVAGVSTRHRVFAARM